ncbi:MAG: inosine/xanthosine triphosphatase [Promethearchaeota archaeon]
MIVRVLIASSNPIKVRAARESFSYFYEELEFSELDAKDLDPHCVHLKSQPIGEKETYESSRWRVKQARNQNPNFNYYVGIEGGVVLTAHNQPRIVVYSSIGDQTFISTVRGCEIPLPLRWYEELVSSPHKELGDIVSKISGVDNIKQKEGAVGFLTQNFIKRIDILKQSMMMALIPFLNPRFFVGKRKIINMGEY